MNAAIIVHGGAGPWNSRGTRLHQAQTACARAAARGQQILNAGGSALDAVEAAVQILEDDPSMDAGRGSYLNVNGEVEMDALIMDGQTLAVGAVGAVQQIRYPISLARRIMDAAPHAFLVGAGAQEFATANGIPLCDPDWLISPAERDRFLDLRRDSDASGPFGDTVGAVAIDQDGNVAAATSTGGTPDKLPGRIGDSPLVGAGAYADNRTGAVGATGHGESIMKVLLSKQVCDYLGAGHSATAACEAAIALMHERVGGQGGVVAVTAAGEIGLAYNTDAMPHALAIGDGTIVLGA